LGDARRSLGSVGESLKQAVRTKLETATLRSIGLWVISASGNLVIDPSRTALTLGHSLDPGHKLRNEVKQTSSLTARRTCDPDWKLWALREFSVKARLTQTARSLAAASLMRGFDSFCELFGWH
jgi:hypothetical protein